MKSTPLLAFLMMGNDHVQTKPNAILKGGAIKNVKIIQGTLGRDYGLFVEYGNNVTRTYHRADTSVYKNDNVVKWLEHNKNGLTSCNKKTSTFLEKLYQKKLQEQGRA